MLFLMRFPQEHFPNCECELYLTKALTPFQCKIFVAYYTSYHRLALITSQWLTIQVLEITNYANFTLTMQLKVRHIWCWSVLSTTPFTIWKCSTKESQVDMRLSLTQAIALCYSRELAYCKPSWCTFDFRPSIGQWRTSSMTIFTH